MMKDLDALARKGDSAQPAIKNAATSVATNQDVVARR